mmetsp:Transcript_8834/g.14574  ORF Transcript_8834/g.14574 Transcript_8834/m.14574 type:complete len:90 (-) Transcript_8834:215-484(-)|eukprot:CAMPEP_0181048782 /NCGR_PEP_ID=MMETSP1070-20121207/15621_1 /TAXON_ID=265543 /ORGANISM="Minutocellus polymorphus, Strain NH13" /LENGTH=89 /DNA_ID=CAMNT_0023127593 /DNA_START=144 /DNA_END=413 /DNA_ORIENTATION=-
MTKSSRRGSNGSGSGSDSRSGSDSGIEDLLRVGGGEHRMGWQEMGAMPPTYIYEPLSPASQSRRKGKPKNTKEKKANLLRSFELQIAIM